MSGKITLENRRILITDVPQGIGNDLCRALIAKKAVVIAFVKTPDHVKNLETAYPSLIPILLDVAKCPEGSRRVLSKLPYLDHIINFSGPVFDNLSGSIHKHYRSENAVLGTTKVDDVVSKLVLAGSRSIIVNFSQTGSTNFSGSSASLAATQFTDALRSSFRKLFRGRSLGTEAESEPTNGATNHKPAVRSSTVPLDSGVQSAPPTRRLSFRLLKRKSTGEGTSLKSNDEKLKKSFTKLHKEFRKVWERKLKKLKSKEERKLSELTREITKYKKQEISSINASNAALNDATLSRAEALSTETANKIVASRERKAEKDASRLASRKFEEKKVEIENAMIKLKAAAAEKHYQKILKREIILLEKRAMATNQP